MRLLNKYLFFSLRPKQWTKNLFIFIPLIFGKKLFIFPNNYYCLGAFFIFSMASSAVYLINDLIDVEADRLHPTKRLRPIASGKVNKSIALGAGSFLGFFAIYLSFMLNNVFCYIVIAYFIFNFIYSRFFKEIVIIDVFCLGIFFLIRLLVGSVLAEVEMSHWLIIMVSLLSFFLGFNKRRQELKLLEKKAIQHRHVLAEYNLYFIDQMIAIITSSIVITYMLYAVDARTVRKFGSNNLMYSIPFVFYGIFRYLYLIHKVFRNGDPTQMLFSDKMLQIDVLMWIGVCIAVIYFHLDLPF